jgi:DNA-binding NarL/FixJ family response regulator
VSPESVAPVVETLTPREHEVAQAVTRGLRNRAIACEFGISEETVKKHLANIYAKLSVDGRVQLTIHLLRSGRPDAQEYPHADIARITR